MLVHGVTSFELDNCNRLNADPNPLLHYVRFRANRAAYAYSLPAFEINLIGTASHGEYLAKK
jgi:hypothetical protein